MSKIKSAWEIAMEKTADLKVDSEKIRKDELVKEGRQLAGKFLNDVSFHLEDLQKAYEKSTDKTLIKEGITAIILVNISLPSNDIYKEKNDRLKELAGLVSKDAETSQSMIDQLNGFYQQYIDNQDQLLDRLKEQFEPQLKQKEAQLKRQYGDNFTMTAEQDPDFMKLVQQQFKRLQQQYQQTLDNFKKQLEASL
ncbi:MAG: hypothetical protein LKE40_05525 [Spirochaetia bacterium]|jgi:hypothetical protein|nr:hypothetical protein [Spirochaetia bacterium]